MQIKQTMLAMIAMVWLGSCLNDRPTRFDHTTPEVPVEVTSPYHGEDRHIWQKPDFIVSKFGSIRGKTVADLGAGSGYFAFRFLKNGANVIAIDIDQRMIDLMESEVNFFPDSLSDNFSARLATANNPGIEQEEIDFLFVANTYTFLENRVQYFSELKAGFKPEGKLLIVDFKKKHTPIGPPQEDRVALGDVEAELIKAGYRIIDSDDSSLSFQYVILASPIK
jgi:ubiquinone/menaquinone biosynthesis C-methylase UbiE